MDIATIRTALATRLATISGVRVSEFAPDVINPPQLIVWGPDPVTYSETWDEGHRLTFDVRLLVDRATDRVSQASLDAYLADSGTSSVYAAVEADNRLGGAVSSAQVVSAQNRGSVQYNDATYLAMDFTVDVMT